MNRADIRKKTVQVASSTMLSRLLGLAREVLMANYLGVGPLADAFLTAFKIPNSLRKVFAEGALSAALLPSFVAENAQNDKKAVNSLMTLSMMIFEGILCIVCLVIFWKAETIIRFIVPGWYCVVQPPATFSLFGIPFIDQTIGSCVAFLSTTQPSQQALLAVSFLRILISFILFLSMSALLASALQSVHRFFVPAFGQVLINVIFITGILVCISYQLPVTYLCFFILLSGIAQFVWHLIAYFNAGFSFGPIEDSTWSAMKKVLHKFIPCLLSMSVMELLLFVSTSVASFLPAGSISLIYYANRFMGIPLGVFSRAFSTVLFPSFARVGTYAHRRLSFYLYEAAKLIFWVMVPVSLMFAFVAHKLFLTLFLSNKFTLANVQEAGTILMIFVIGLFFFSLNHILLNLYYALHETRIPLIISCVVLATDLLLSYFVLMPLFGATGIALATVIVSALQTALFAYGLYYFFGFTFYGTAFAQFAAKSLLQCALVSGLFLILYYALIGIISMSFGSSAPMFLNSLIFWVWFIPLAGIFFGILFKTRKLFGIKLYFLE
ncbi:MAG: putative peptidoglycan biosynthesis protein MurJ [Candidatus Dependentiae bacterium ADurb.Bin331]|nr:MAG: putative peptidoglycan biosynthesis protein MurJ [Candidatus Dependentiae bacterium ADurb.Bin331]